MSSSRTTLIVLFVLGAALWVFLSRGSHSSNLPYVSGWSQAIEASRSQGKPILLKFGGPWCPACVALETKVFSDSRIRKLAQEFICVEVDPRSPGDGADAFRFKSTRYVPEVVFLSPEGEVLSRLERRDPDGVVAEMQAVLSRASGVR